MKRILLSLSLLLGVAGMTMAQDIYLGTYYYEGTDKCYTLSKNGTVLKTHSNSGYSYEMTDMIAADDYVFYLNHLLPTDNDPMRQWTDVRVQDGGENNCVYNCPIGQGIHLKGLAYENGDIYACGSFHSEDGRDYAMITKNDEVLYKNNENGYYCDMYGITVSNGDVYTCGGEASNEGSSGEDWVYVQVWKNGAHYADAYNYGEYSFAYDIVMYNNALYMCGKIKQDGVWKGALWKVTVSPSPTITLLGTVSDQESICKKLTVDGGNIYVSYMVYGVEGGVWKYNVRENVLWKYYSYISANASSGNIVANNHGVYTTANGASRYYLDGEAVSVSDEGYVSKIAVVTNNQYTVHELPFEDHFENGETYWDEWIAYDYDETNGNFTSYWDRIDYSGDGEYAAWHRWGCDELQQGDLASPAIKIPSDANAMMSFFMKAWDLEDYESEGSTIWIIEDDGTLTTDNYTTFNQDKIWVMDDVLDELEENYWKQFYIDLSEYKGKTIRVVFYYSASCAHAWVVDDFEVWIDSYDGLGENASTALSVCPNPASESIRVEGLEADCEVRIFNVLGELVKTAYTGNGKEIGISDLADGVYMLRCGNATLRFVKTF